MHNTINYFALFAQLQQFLPMLRAQAYVAVDYGDSVTGRIHHRIEYMHTANGPQFVLRRVDPNGSTSSGVYLGNCRIEQVITVVQDWIQDAHRPRRNPVAKLFASKTQPKMQYFAY